MTDANVTSVELSVPAASTPRLLLAVPAFVRSDRLLDLDNLVPIDVVIVLEKEESSLIAAANSFSVFKAPGAESTKSDTDESTYALMDCCVAK